MKNLVSALIIALLASTLACKRVPSIGGNEPYTLRVTSANPNQEVVFEGTYTLQSDGPEQRIVNKSTPFELRLESNIKAGVFRLVSGAQNLKLELIRGEGANKKVIAWGEGKALSISANGDSASVNVSS
jgi:hypothetical protein